METKKQRKKSAPTQAAGVYKLVAGRQNGNSVVVQFQTEPLPEILL